ncbi:DUF4263 domain-containing protein [Frankia sp. Mgl5]|uniref:Shedu anti-phage system protein SduA domain-containing protein n=1 Tax=Frankia sp. Mgl5 TaxID=2933793 RepID=UPI002010A592|nr:Shedu anti-phage system protein SduA domain-containing protein [Frankia sp. Mgl5]MCK9928847.1 DUF4263 domain-containing protein [Frankia sp. Mgl5]
MVDQATQLERRAANSGRVSFSRPIAIRSGSSRSHFEVIPQYIPHKNGPDTVAAKLSYWSKASRSVRFGHPAEITLNEKETRHLRDILDQALALAGAGKDGGYLLVPLDGPATSTADADPGDIGRAVTALVANTDVLAALTEDPETVRRLSGLQGALRVAELVAAVDQFEEFLSSGINAESTYQTWCENHAWAFGNAYTMRDDVRTIALGDEVDHLMELTANGFRDIFELKRPDHSVIHWDSSHKCYYWSSDVSKTIGQCHRYMDALHEGAAKGLRDHPEVIAYHPTSTIVIGRSNDWSKDQLRALHGLNARLKSITVMTYDQLLAQAKQLLVTIQATAQSE